MTDEKIEAMRRRLRDWTSREPSQREPVPYTPPRYDEVFDEGMRWLDEQMTNENTFDNLLAAAAAHRDEVTVDYGHRCLADDCCTRRR